MKKVLTILVVLALVAGFAFAEVAPAPKTEETHTLTITASVDAVIPQFQLFRGEVKTNDTPNFFDNATPSYSDTDAAGFMLDEGGSVVVVAKVANPAKQKQSYTLQFTDGGFKNVKRNGEDGTQDPSSITVEKNDTPTTGVALSQVKDSDTVTAAFTGTKMTVSGYTLATATYTYGADSTIDPGTYTADIVLTINAI